MIPAPLIVYIDDEHANRVVFEASLKSHFRIETFASGEEGLARLIPGDVAVLVTDQRMPGMSGNEVLRLARERSPQTERVVLTAYDEAGPILEALNSGLASRYVVKPWVRAELIATLESCLAVHRLRSEKLDLEHRLFAGERFVTLGAIASGVFHDMSQPLLVMSSTLPTFTSDDPDALVDSRAAVEQLAALVRGAKMFLTPGKTIESIGDAASAARTAIALCRGRIAQGEIDFKCELADALPPTPVPTPALVQVLVNLLVNAAQARRTEGPRSTIRLTIAIANGGILMTVRDNGSGMSPEVLAHVREPFFTTKPAGEGTGLGLFSCQRLVAGHGGTLEIQSTQGEGTTVSAWIPEAPTR